MTLHMVWSTVVLTVLSATEARGASEGASDCPHTAMHVVDVVSINNTLWTVCEDLQLPGGSIVLVSSTGRHEWFSKSYEVYGSANDTAFYLNLTKDRVVKDPVDLLAQKLLSSNYTHLTWQLVASAIPPIRNTGGVRAFVGSRGSVADTTFNDAGEDAAGYGFPPALSYVFNLTNIAEGGAAIKNAKSYLNYSGMAEGLVGGYLPNVVFYYPVMENSEYLPDEASGSRYWTMIATATPDMNGSREQSVWFRFQQVQCVGTAFKPPCALIGHPQYWDTYWWSRSPDGHTDMTGPENGAVGAGFYDTLLQNRQWWEEELASEGMMELSLPSPSSTNGSWILMQAKANIIKSMITWHNVWGPRYGVLPGYGITMQNGFEDTFTSIATAALEWGAIPYARGLVDHQYKNYIRYDGLINYRAEEVAQQARMLTILALYYRYTGDDSFVLSHFDKAKALATWLIARRNTTLKYGPDDPRYGQLLGLDEGDSFVRVYFHQNEANHWYAATAETYRAFAELGTVWSSIGTTANRSDISSHGADILHISSLLYRDLHISLNKTVNTTASPGHRCRPPNSDGATPNAYYGATFRAYSELFYSGALTLEQTEDMYTSGLGVTSCEVGRWLSLGVPASGIAMFVHIPQGFPYGLLVHDQVEKFLLYFFTHSAHANTRGTFTTPESTRLDRNEYDYAYASPGQGNVPMCLKWMLCFEEPETHTVWIAKATPRDWLVPGEAPLVANNLPTRYGRISFSINPTNGSSGRPYSVRINIQLPNSFVSEPPAGGIRIRIRAPVEYAGKLGAVTLGGKEWTSFSASEETVDVDAAQLDKFQNAELVAVFSGRQVAIQQARINLSERVVHPPARPEPAPVVNHTSEKRMSQLTLPTCPSGMDQVDTYSTLQISWVVCEDLQQADGAIALLSTNGTEEWFTKSFAEYESNWTDNMYYLGLTKKQVANATEDVLGAKLLAMPSITWSAVEKAVPPIRTSGRGGSWGSNCAGVRTFVGSRGASVDTTFDDHGGDCNWEGWPSWHSLAINKHNDAVGEPEQTYNSSASADGIVGNFLPTAVFYLPMLSNGSSQFRYWTYVAVPVPDMHGNREQSVWFRFQQVQCSGLRMKPPCKLHGWPMYWDSYWYTRFPGANKTDTIEQTLATGPIVPASASGFYSNLIQSRDWWNDELAEEDMMSLELPSLATTNGTWLYNQARHSIIKSMISRENTWHPRYGVSPGYGSIEYDGVHCVFTTTATMAIEWGAMKYARGVIENQFDQYVRTDGMVWYRALELPSSARMLTVLAFYHSVTQDAEFLAARFSKASGLANLLIQRYTQATQYSLNDTRYGIPLGPLDGSSASSQAEMNHDVSSKHWYASASELYRACTEIGKVWTSVGKTLSRDDIALHGKVLGEVAPKILQNLYSSQNRTMRFSVNQERCWQQNAEGESADTSFRGFSELLYSGVVSHDQIKDIYHIGTGNYSCGSQNTLILGSPGGGGSAMTSATSHGFAYGLLQHDMISEFLLHFFAISAHGMTRGTWTSPEVSNVADRDDPSGTFSTASITVVPTYLKWSLCFEDVTTSTVWLGKAIPREWMAPGTQPLRGTRMPTRYGRVSLELLVASTGTYMVYANVSLPETFVGSSAPAGGLKLRLRPPNPLKRKILQVTVGGKQWSSFDVDSEVISFSQTQLSEVARSDLETIVTTFHDI